MLHLLLGISAVIITVIIETITIVILLKYLFKAESRGKFGTDLLYDMIILSLIMVILFCGHLIQIAIWGELFVLCGQFDEFSNAFYHSMVNYSSLGYGDIVMTKEWRLLGAMEAVNGILLFGVSAAVFFTVLRDIFQQRINKMRKQL